MKILGIFVVLLNLCSANLLAGQGPFSEGVKAHSAKNYALAAQKFTEAIAAEPNNSSAYYNLGLAEMGNLNFGSAIWAFEKVLKLDPNDGEALARLERCQEELNPGESYQPVLNGMEATLFGISSDNWSLLAIVASLALGLCLVLFKIKRSLSLRRVFLVTGFFALLVLVFSIWTASATAAYFGSEQYGVVVKSSISTFIDPENPDEEELKEGTRLLLEGEGEGLLVRVKDNTGREYLVKQADLRYF